MQVACHSIVIVKVELYYYQILFLYTGSLKKQPTTARSSAEAEVYALDMAVSNAKYTDRKREEFFSQSNIPYDCACR